MADLQVVPLEEMQQESWLLLFLSRLLVWFLYSFVCMDVYLV
jgi:hypothetical protein